MYKKLDLSFDSTWVLSKKDDDILPIQAFVNYMKEVFDIEVVDTSLTECTIIVKNGDAEHNDIVSKVQKFLKERFDIENEDTTAEYYISEYTVEEKTGEVKGENKPSVASVQGGPVSAEAKAEDAADVQTAYEKICGLVGAEEFKALADEYSKVAPLLLKYNTVDTLLCQSYLFSINDGNGLTTVLNLLADHLEELGLFKFSETNRVIEEKLGPPITAGMGADAFSQVLARFKRFGSDGGKVICIDITEWMTQISHASFREFLSKIEDRMGQNIVVFRIPFVEKEVIYGIENGLNDVLSIRDISFVPFDKCELVKCAEDTLSGLGFTMEQEAWDVFHARVCEEKGDGRFYGFNTVNKIIREMIYLKQYSNAQNGIDDTLIKGSEILKLSSTYEDSPKSGLEILEGYIGMESICKQVKEIIAQIEVSVKNKKLGSPCLHMRFVGNPGTGKTTVARVIGQILKEKGILRNGGFFECSGRDLCGTVVGSTAPKTAALCRDAYGSVLFIDEAYSLYKEGYSSVDYGREAIDTLIAEMENHRSDLVVIMAGYPEEMAHLMKANAGLESRMPYMIEFPNYTREQLADIYMLMVNKSFSYLDGFENAVRSYFDSLPDDVIGSKEFSNARFVRNLYERTWGKAAMRAQLNKEDEIVLIKEDFIGASSEKEFKVIMKKQKRSLGFV